MLLLAIDIGNTNISCGIFCGGKLRNRFDIETKKYSRAGLFKKLAHHPGISAAVLCSVVPRLDRVIRKDLADYTGGFVYQIGKEIKVPIENRYRFPGQVGQDRLVNAYAASRLYRAPLVVIDSGTAITFDAVSGDKAYLGGLIFPGMRISLAALSEKTALLPEAKLGKPKGLIGKDTESSILNGVVLGTAALCKELSRRIKKELGGKTKIIGTGGNIPMIRKYSGIKMEINKELTLLGIRLIYEEVAEDKKRLP
ncbi:MAG: type III pantothenate kinase [Candidatus Omnitrophota bacterium]